MKIDFEHEYVARIQQLAAKVRAWLDANPNATPLIQWNFPPEMLVSAPLGIGMHSHLVTANADGMNLLNSLRGKDVNEDPTIFMCRIAIEHAPQLAPPQSISTPA